MQKGKRKNKEKQAQIKNNGFESSTTQNQTSSILVKRLLLTKINNT